MSFIYTFREASSEEMQNPGNLSLLFTQEDTFDACFELWSISMYYIHRLTRQLVKQRF